MWERANMSQTLDKYTFVDKVLEACKDAHPHSASMASIFEKMAVKVTVQHPEDAQNIEVPEIKNCIHRLLSSQLVPASLLWDMSHYVSWHPTRHPKTKAWSLVPLLDFIYTVQRLTDTDECHFKWFYVYSDDALLLDPVNGTYQLKRHGSKEIEGVFSAWKAPSETLINTFTQIELHHAMKDYRSKIIGYHLINTQPLMTHILGMRAMKTAQFSKHYNQPEVLELIKNAQRFYQHLFDDCNHTERQSCYTSKANVILARRKFYRE
jgi:hypothetical protein